MSDVYTTADRTWSIFRLDDAFARRRPAKGDKAAPLERWYWSVGDTPIAELSDLDVATAMRQSIHLPLVFPEAVRRLTSDLWSGRYPGELLCSLVTVPLDLWVSHVEERARAMHIARTALSSEQPDALDDQTWVDVQDEVRAWLGRATLANGGAAQLQLVKAPGGEAMSIDISPGTEVSIGAAPTSTIRLLAAGLGRTHAVLKGELDGVRLRAHHPDVKVNGELVEEAMLADGDKIEMGKIALEFRAGRASP